MLPPAGQTLVGALKTLHAAARGNGLHLTGWDGEGQLVGSGPGEYPASEGGLSVPGLSVILLLDGVQYDGWPLKNAMSFMFLNLT